MRLGDSIIGGKPMRIPGIVDVYQVGDEWIARSWPKQQNQPNSAAQLLWRKKFADAHYAVNSFRGTYLEKWKEIECPPGKCWIDVAIHSHLVFPGGFAAIPSQFGCKFEVYYSKAGYYYWDHHFNYPYAWFWNLNAYYFMTTGASQMYTRGSAWADVMQWNDMGYICPAGKRPRKCWVLTFKSDWPTYDAYTVVDIEGQSCSIHFYNNLPNGITTLRLNRLGTTSLGGKDYCLSSPPIFCPVQTWPGAFHP